MKPYILLVEDNPDDIELTQRAFANNHILNDLVVLTDGAQACEFLFESDRDGRGFPRIILLDLKLPKLSGLEVLERIRGDERTRLIPTVILTASKHEEDSLRGYRHGVNSYVRKPVDFGEFVEAVRQVGLYWLVLNEPPPSAMLSAPLGAGAGEGRHPCLRGPLRFSCRTAPTVWTVLPPRPYSSPTAAASPRLRSRTAAPAAQTREQRSKSPSSSRLSAMTPRRDLRKHLQTLFRFIGDAIYKLNPGFAGRLTQKTS